MSKDISVNRNDLERILLTAEAFLRFLEEQLPWPGTNRAERLPARWMLVKAAIRRLRAVAGPTPPGGNW